MLKHRDGISVEKKSTLFRLNPVINKTANAYSFPTLPAQMTITNPTCRINYMLPEALLVFCQTLF